MVKWIPKDLLQRIGSFKEDLNHRLPGLTIVIPNQGHAEERPTHRYFDHGSENSGCKAGRQAPASRLVRKIILLGIAPDFKTDLVVKIEQNRRRRWATSKKPDAGARTLFADKPSVTIKSDCKIKTRNAASNDQSRIEAATGLCRAELSTREPGLKRHGDFFL